MAHYTIKKKDGKKVTGSRLMTATDVRRMAEWATQYKECYVVKQVGTKRAFNVGACKRPSNLSALAGHASKRSLKSIFTTVSKQHRLRR